MRESIRVLYATNEPEYGAVVKNSLEETASQLPYLDQTRSDIEADD